MPFIFSPVFPLWLLLTHFILFPSLTSSALISCALHPSFPVIPRFIHQYQVNFFISVLSLFPSVLRVATFKVMLHMLFFVSPQTLPDHLLAGHKTFTGHPCSLKLLLFQGSKGAGGADVHQSAVSSFRGRRNFASFRSQSWVHTDVWESDYGVGRHSSK